MPPVFESISVYFNSISSLMASSQLFPFVHCHCSSYCNVYRFPPSFILQGMIFFFLCVWSLKKGLLYFFLMRIIVWQHSNNGQFTLKFNASLMMTHGCNALIYLTDEALSNVLCWIRRKISNHKFLCLCICILKLLSKQSQTFRKNTVKQTVNMSFGPIL